MVVNRVAPLSAAKIVGLLYIIMGLVFGAAISFVAMAGLAVGEEGALTSALFGVGSIIILPILYGCLGFIGTIIVTALYNLLAGIVGGVELDVR